MHNQLSGHAISRRSSGKRIFALVAIALAGPVWAHHPMGGAVPATAWHGLLSGLGHPLIEIDHLLFLLGAAVALVMARTTPGRAGALLLAYAIAGAVGTSLRVPGTLIPMPDAAVAASLLMVAVWLWMRQMPGAAGSALAAALAGFFHGYAYGEAVIGAETTPLVAYLFGLAAVQVLLMTAVYSLTRRLAQMTPRVVPAAARALAVVVSATALWVLRGAL